MDQELRQDRQGRTGEPEKIIRIVQSAKKTEDRLART
jgi:hypothetical protein